MANLKEGFEKRRKAIDEASGFGDEPEAVDSPSEEAKEEEGYDRDFDTEAKIKDLKDKKAELLKGVSRKTPAERKALEKKLKELNDKIMDLESS